MTALPASPAVFLDRDGVINRDVGPVLSPDQLEILPGVPLALARLARAGFKLVVITNQSVIARGLITESQLHDIHQHLIHQLLAAGAPALSGIYFCPHHPNADLPEFRTLCSCRKPGIGLVTRAASELSLILPASFFVGDRPTDVLAGRAAGCRTIWVETGQHLAPPIQSAQPVDPRPVPDLSCPDLPAAVDWILRSPPA